MSNIIKHDFQGIKIAFEGKEQISMTDLWKASGSNEFKRPAHWIQQDETQAFIATVAQNLNVRQDHIITSKRGKYGGTWAHWQVALAYAKYLNPALHLFVNQCFVDHMKEEANPSLKMDKAIEGYRRKGMSDLWIDARFKSKLSTKARNQILSSRQGGNGNIYAMCANATNKAVVQMEAQEYRTTNQLAKTVSIRDHMTTRQLLEIALTEEVASERIVESNIMGNAACANVHSVIGSRIHQAVTMRGV